METDNETEQSEPQKDTAWLSANALAKASVSAANTKPSAPCTTRSMSTNILTLSTTGTNN
jgi:hypothetical protein